MLEEQRKTAEVRKFLTEVYNQVGSSVELKSQNDSEVLDLASNLRTGLPFATPVCQAMLVVRQRSMTAVRATRLIDL